MIRLVRPVRVPARLASAGTSATAAIVAQYQSDRASYDSGAKRFTFERTIYGHPTVKAVLERVQAHKCCYCEGTFKGHAAGDVEHYRPKGYVQQDEASPKTYPGYYWLGYAWSNLLFSCQDCNRVHKRNYFPLADPARRSRDPGGNLALEEPLILDPYGPDDPRDHVRFHREVPQGLTEVGRKTVFHLGLDRLALSDRRREHLTELERLRDAVELLEADQRPEAIAFVTAAKAKLARAMEPDAVYSAMVRDVLGPMRP